MYLSRMEVSNFRHFGEGDAKLILELGEGLTAIVGENDAGKTAIIDILRMVLGTRDQEYLRLQATDFHYSTATGQRAETVIAYLTFSNLVAADKAAFLEYLTYDASGHPSELHITWTAKRVEGNKRFVPLEWRSGNDGQGPALDAGARALLMATYLRPLRDAEKALSAGRGSRLAQILQNTKEVLGHGTAFDEGNVVGLDPKTLNLLGLLDFTNYHLKENEGVKKTRARLNDNFLSPLSFANDPLTAHFGVGGKGEDAARLRQMLEKLEVILNASGISDGSLGRGLGSNNVLFMACELLLLAEEEEGYPLLMIEEPEAHLHPQRQLRLMSFLQQQVEKPRADGQKIQVIVTTHSPNLASEITLNNVILLKDRKAFSLAKGKTALDPSDYAFLQRYLDVTKANLFFARRVMIVEGPAEELLLPAFAKLLKRDFSAYGVSIVNVGGTGLGRFGRIFQRADPAKGVVDMPVACVTDLDVMPDVAPELLGCVKPGTPYPELGTGTRRKWRARRDFPGNTIDQHRVKLQQRADGQSVKTFVAGQWTLEYDLAHAGLEEELHVAIRLAEQDDAILVSPAALYDAEIEDAKLEYATLLAATPDAEERCSTIYEPLARQGGVSKAITAQYLARYLSEKFGADDNGIASLRDKLPAYLIEALEYVTEPLPAPVAGAGIGPQ